MLKTKIAQDIKIERKQRKKEKVPQNFEIFKLSINLPKIFTSVLDLIILLTNRTKDEILTEFIVNELECFCDDLDSLILRILENGDFLENCRCGLNQFYGYERYEKKAKGKKRDLIKCEFITVEFSVRLPKQLHHFVSKVCKLFGLSRECFLTPFLIGRFEFIYTCPEVMLDYIQYDTKFFDNFRAGINYYYGKEIYKN